MSDALEEHDGKVSIGGRNITNLRFADDIDALAEEEQELEALVESIHVISHDFGGSSRFGAFPHGLPLGRRNLPTRHFSNVIFLGPYFSPNILSFTAVSTWRINCLQRQKCLTFIDLIDDH